jgi:hypothetical protein
MAPLKARSVRLVLLLALLLPLQSLAWVNCNAPDTASLAAHQHCEDSAGAAQSGDLPQQHHHCGSCCVAAIAATPQLFTPPSFTNAGILLPAHWPRHAVTLDRLDRPPRLVTR